MKLYSPAIGVSPSQVFAKKPDLNFFRKLPWKHPGQRKIFVSASTSPILQILGFDYAIHGLIRNKTRITINKNTSKWMRRGHKEVLFSISFQTKRNQNKAKQNKRKKERKNRKKNVLY